MKKQAIMTVTYMVVGLVSGVFYREYTKLMGFTGETQLSTIHTHALVLGMLFFLIVLALEPNFQLSKMKEYRKFLISYNAGVALTLVMMVVRGILQVQGFEGNGAISGLAGVGHILVTIGLVFFVRILFQAIDLWNGATNA